MLVSCNLSLKSTALLFRFPALVLWRQFSRQQRSLCPGGTLATAVGSHVCNQLFRRQKTQKRFESISLIEVRQLVVFWREGDMHHLVQVAGALRVLP